MRFKANKMHVAGAHTGDGDEEENEAVHGDSPYANALASYCEVGIKHFNWASKPAEQKAADLKKAKKLEGEVRSAASSTLSTHAPRHSRTHTTRHVAPPRSSRACASLATSPPLPSPPPCPCPPLPSPPLTHVTARAGDGWARLLR